METRDEIMKPTAAQIEAHDAAMERAKALGLVDWLVCGAQASPEWRTAVERKLANGGPLGKLCRGGSKPRDAWRKQTLLARKLRTALDSDPEALVDFANASAVVAGALDDTPPSAPGEGASAQEMFLIGWFTPDGEIDARTKLVELVCDTLEVEDDPCEIQEAQAPEAAASVDDAQVQELRTRVRSLETGLAERDRQIKALKKERNAARAESSRQGSLADSRLKQVRETDAEIIRLRAAERAARSERDELERQNQKLRAQSESDKLGKKTLEQRSAEERRELGSSLTELRDRLEHEQTLTAAMEKRVAGLETELESERSRREELEGTLDAFGLNEIVSSSVSFGDAIDVLIRFRDAVVGYADRQREQEAERERAERAVEIERQRVEDAKRAQAEAEQAWIAHRSDQLEKLEATLFPEGELDDVFIDGHNLILRVFRPEDEARTRPWLERVMVEFATHLEAEHGWQTRFHLVFDTGSASNSSALGHGVTSYFHEKAKGGADEKIAQLLRERVPNAKCAVVSSDRKHVWDDALRAVEDEGRDVDIFQVELLAEYLQLLDESMKAARH